MKAAGTSFNRSGPTDLSSGSPLGASIPGAHNARLAAGRGTYVADLVARGMCHVAIVRSPHAHAWIRGIDTAAAQALPGVVHIATGAEVREHTHPIPEGWDATEVGAKRVDWYALCRDRTRYVGEAVAAVVAEDNYTAYAAADLVRVTYEPLPAVMDATAASIPDGPRVEPEWDDNVLYRDGFTEGDPESVFRGATQVVEGSIASQRITGVPIEPRGIMASYDPAEGFLTFWESTQQPHPVRSFLAQALAMPENKIRVIQPQVGGAFGLKQPTSQEEVLVAHLARRVGRPVRWIEDRTESLSVGGHSRETTCSYRVAFNRDGIIEALDVEIVADVGAPTAYQGWGMSIVTMISLPSVYQIPNVSVRLTCLVTNKCPWTPYRGFGKDVASLVMDRIVEHVAREARLDRTAVRFANLVPPGAFPLVRGSGSVLDSGDYPGVLKRLLDMIDYESFPELQMKARSQGRRIGLGIGQEITPEGFALPGSLMNNGYDGATIRVSPTGEVTVLTGVTSPGTGNETAIAQIAASELGCDFDAVRVVQGDTDICPWGLGNFSSRSIIIGGSAVQLAAAEIRGKMFKVAASMLDRPSDVLEAWNGRIAVRDAPDEGVTFDAVAREIYWHAYEEHADGIEPSLEVTKYFRIPNISREPDADGKINVYPTWANGAAACVVDVDPETGIIKILRYCMVEDAGSIVNPLLANANLHGAITQGIGSALYEQIVYDAGGAFLTGSLMDYTIPTAVEIPSFEIAHHETPSPFTPLGTKGLGESGLGASLAAICNAVEDAFPELDLWIDRLPLTPARVWRAISNARASNMDHASLGASTTSEAPGS